MRIADILARNKCLVNIGFPFLYRSEQIVHGEQGCFND